MTYDNVCGMKLNNIHDLPRSAYRGIMDYFCYHKCKEIFDNNPEVIISGIRYDLHYSKSKPEACQYNEKILISYGHRR